MQVDRLVRCLKEYEREAKRMEAAAIKAGNADRNLTPTQVARNAETARDCAVQMRRLKHTAHCMAVEAGIADMRDNNYYRPTTAPAGFGREFEMERPRPAFQGSR